MHQRMRRLGPAAGIDHRKPAVAERRATERRGGGGIGTTTDHAREGRGRRFGVTRESELAGNSTHCSAIFASAGDHGEECEGPRVSREEQDAAGPVEQIHEGIAGEDVEVSGGESGREPAQAVTEAGAAQRFLHDEQSLVVRYGHRDPTRRAGDPE